MRGSVPSTERRIQIVSCRFYGSREPRILFRLKKDLKSTLAPWVLRVQTANPITVNEAALVIIFVTTMKTVRCCCLLCAFCFCCFAEKSASHGQRHQPAVARASDAGDWRLSARVTDYVDFCFHTKAHEEHTRGSTTHGD